MLTMTYDIQIGQYSLGMLDKVEIHRSVELLADTATITLPATQYNETIDVEGKINRGDRVVIRLGYEETGIVTEFTGYLQRIGTDGGNITLYCEDDLFLFRNSVTDRVLKQVTVESLLKLMVAECALGLTVDCSYAWTYSKFVIQDATAYDVLKKIQEECGADIYLADGKLHVHPPGQVIGKERYYHFGKNVEKEDLQYKNADDKKVKIVVKALMPDGTVKEIETGSTGGETIEVKAATTDEASMKQRGELEWKRRCFDGYEGSITTWLIPECKPGDTARLHDPDYYYKDGTYFVEAVDTSFSSQGGERKVTLGFRLS